MAAIKRWLLATPKILITFITITEALCVLRFSWYCFSDRAAFEIDILNITIGFELWPKEK